MEIFKHVIGVDWIINFDERVTVRTAENFLQATAGEVKAQRYEEIKRSLLTKSPSLTGAFGKLENEKPVQSEIDEKIYNKIWKLLQAKKPKDQK
jgi:hypothetical protein